MALALSRARRQRASQAPRAQRAGTSSFPSAWERQLRLSTQPRSFSQPRNLGVVLREVCEMALVLEYIIVGVLVATNLSVGLYFSFRKANVGPGSKVTATEVFLGGRMLKTFPLAASSVVSLFSSTGLIGLPAHYYAYGWHMTWSFLTPLFCIPFGTHVFMPVLYRLRITSIFESIVGASSVFAASLALVTGRTSWCCVDGLFAVLSHSDRSRCCRHQNNTGFFVAKLTDQATEPFGHRKVYRKSLTMVYNGMTAPFVGLCLLGVLFPFVRAKGAGVATTAMVVYQLLHIASILRSGRNLPRMETSLDYCFLNGSGISSPLNTTFDIPQEEANDSFILFRVSSLWSSFFAIFGTVLLGVIVSAVTGEFKTREDLSPLCWNCAVRFWEKSTFLSRQKSAKESKAAYFGTATLNFGIEDAALLSQNKETSA
ncbi:uncharacterized protein [Dermacentor albipictus]|uniref:uncharacterized protein isoform X3 n=1 Tax=Dermacentor albipictus TaxID=60249 RepID=UPI0031FBCCE3